MKPKCNLSLVVITTLFLFVAFPINCFGQGKHEKREQKIEESAKAKGVSGGITFQTDLAFDKVYDAILNYLKRQEYTIDSASKETGQIITAMTIKGGYTQTGTRIYVTLIKDNDSSTSLRVAVSEQKRKKLLQTEPWGDPRVNSEKSSKLAEDMKTVLKST